MRLEAAAQTLLGVAVIEVRRLSGGDLSAVSLLRLADGRQLVAKQGPAVTVEAAMLGAVAATGAPAPAVIAVARELLLIEAIEGNAGPGAAWDDLARVLRRLHAATDDSYGWHEDYGFGEVAIGNARSTNWPDFWAGQRLRCHLPHLPVALARRVERLAERLPEHLPATPAAALLHGDLWGGNILAAGDRIAALIDPACYHGDREVDAAMLTLFDRPPARFVDALALDPGWRERQPVYRLWPLLVHVRLFGGSYEAAASAELRSLGC